MGRENGGNISVDLSDIMDEVESDAPYKPLPVQLPMESANRVYYVKGTCLLIRELRDADYAGCILRINGEANSYPILWRGKASTDFAPTSEFISHIKILTQQQKENSGHKAVIHTHPLELIALSHHPKI